MRIRIGMPIADVERILGKGCRVSAESFQTVDYDEPDIEKRRRPVVDGDVRFAWTSKHHFEIVVGVRNGVVCDKWCWVPGL